MNLKGKSFLTLKDFTKSEINHLLNLSLKLKKERHEGIRKKYLDGKSIALLFEKTSTRTRCAFSVAISDCGGNSEYLGRNDIQMGKKESIEDTAKVLGRMFDGIEYRGFSHQKIKDLAKHAGVPVWNGLTDEFHPTQVLADLLTVQEVKGTLEGLKFVYVGDGRNNMANSLMIGSSIMGIDFRILSPKKLWPNDNMVKTAQDLAKENGGTITISDQSADILDGADVLYTDVWVSMGEEEFFEERIKLLKDYQVNREMLNKTNNNDIIFLHCLPAFHNRETEMGEDIYQRFNLFEMEVTNEVFSSKNSYVFDQAENRLHTIKALMVATL